MKSDIEIAKEYKLKRIKDIASKYGLDEEDLVFYGKYKAKIEEDFISKVESKKDGNLVLVTSINPTPLGEGKTTVSIGLADGLNLINKKAILALREPSLGPVFGIKGGAAGGGYSQVLPMEDINLHFTGDIHAITAANNLLSALIDNHIFNGNELRIKEVTHKRCLDLNDRSLRTVTINQSGEKRMVPRVDHFDISVASEIMAIFCLAEDMKDLKRRLGKIVIGIDEDDNLVYAKDIHAEGSMAVLLRDALSPNIVQTLGETMAIVHGGPFANIAHGCNSIRATRLALKLADYTITEAGFGADLGAEKFVDVKCNKAKLDAKVAVCVATLKALKYHGGAPISECKEENLEYLEKGYHNLIKHVSNLKNEFNMYPIVAINKYATDTDKELKFLEEKLKEDGVEVAICDPWGQGGKGCTDLAEKVAEACETKKEYKATPCYENSDSLRTKIEKVATKIYGAKDVEFSEVAEEKLKLFEKYDIKDYQVCIAKTQYSLSDDPKNLLCDELFTLHVSDLELKNGAEFVVAKTGKVVTMPGLPKVPAANNIDLDENNEIVGLF